MLATTLLAKSIVFKAALTAAALSVTGATVAAETGTLPAPVQQLAHQYAGAVGVPAPSPSTSGAPTAEPTSNPSAEPSEKPSGEPSEEPDDHGSGPDASGPAAFGLCRAYLAGGHGNSGSPAMRALVTAAGGADKVTGYCQGVVQARKSATPEHPAGKTEDSHHKADPGTGKSHAAKPTRSSHDGAPSPGAGNGHGGKPTPKPSSKGKGGGH